MTVVLFDLRKAFGLIDHHVPTRKLSAYDIPSPIMCLIIAFLRDHKQRMKLSGDCLSEWETVPAGVPQGTKLGPWLFVIMINDLSVSNSSLWKCLDDTTLAEVISKNGSNLMQSRITINEKEIEVVSSANLLGVTISDNLKWNAHVEAVCKKVAARLYFLKQLKRAEVPPNYMIFFYLTCIRPVLEYACHVFHAALLQYLSNEMERMQKRALRIVYPDLASSKAL